MNKTLIKIGVFIFFLVSFILILGNIYRIVSTTAPDFGVLWISAKDLLIAKDPYYNPALTAPNAYPPISEIFYLPLALFPYQVGQAIFVFGSFASIVGLIYLSIKLAAGKVFWPYLLAFIGLTFMSFPTKFSLGMGQINPIVLFLLLLATYLESKGKSVAGSIIMGVAVALKPIFVFFLLFFVLKRSWKIVFLSILTVALLVIISFISWPPEIWVSWFKTAIFPLSNFAGREAYVNQGVLGFISRFVSDIGIRIYLNAAVSIFLIGLAAFLRIKNKNAGLGLSFFIITLLLFDTTSWQHHFVWLVFPFIILFYYIIRVKSFIFMTLLVFSYFLASWNFKNPYVYPVILQSNQFYGSMILWGLNFYFLTARKIKATKAKGGSLRYKIFELLNLE